MNLLRKVELPEKKKKKQNLQVEALKWFLTKILF